MQLVYLNFQYVFAIQRSSFPICSFIILGNSTMFVYFFKIECQHVLLLGAFQHVRLFIFFKIPQCSFIRYSFLCSFIRYLRVALKWLELPGSRVGRTRGGGLEGKFY